MDLICTVRSKSDGQERIGRWWRFTSPEYDDGGSVVDGDDDAVVLRAQGGDDGLQEDTAEMMTRFRRRERPVAARRRGRSGASAGELRVLDGQVAPEVLGLGEEGDWVRHDEVERMERSAASTAS